jgi:hypothetical protein
MISLYSDLVYTYDQQIFIDEIQVYSRRHIQLSSMFVILFFPGAFI